MLKYSVLILVFTIAIVICNACSFEEYNKLNELADESVSAFASAPGFTNTITNSAPFNIDITGGFVMGLTLQGHVANLSIPANSSTTFQGVMNQPHYIDLSSNSNPIPPSPNSSSSTGATGNVQISIKDNLAVSLTYVLTSTNGGNPTYQCSAAFIAISSLTLHGWGIGSGSAPIGCSWSIQAFSLPSKPDVGEKISHFIIENLEKGKSIVHRTYTIFSDDSPM